MAATQPIYDVNVLTQPAGGSNVTVVGPVDGSGNIKVAVESAPGSQTVTGPDASGTAPTGDPVLAAGSDGTDVRTLHTDIAGNLDVNVQGTVPVSGTFFQATQPVSGTFWQTTQPVSIAATVTADISNQPGVQGLVADATAVTGYPVLMGASDGVDARTLSSDTSGKLNVNVSNTPAVTVSGTPDVAVTSVTPPSTAVSGQTTIATANTAVQLA